MLAVLQKGSKLYNNVSTDSPFHHICKDQNRVCIWNACEQMGNLEEANSIPNQLAKSYINGHVPVLTPQLVH